VDATVNIHNSLTALFCLF